MPLFWHSSESCFVIKLFIYLNKFHNLFPWIRETKISILDNLSSKVDRSPMFNLEVTKLVNNELIMSFLRSSLDNPYLGSEKFPSRLDSIFINSFLFSEENNPLIPADISI